MTRFDRIVLSLAGPVMLIAGFAAGHATAPDPEPTAQMRCMEDEVRAYWWTGDAHTLESCLHLDDIDPRVKAYAEEVIGQQGAQR